MAVFCISELLAREMCYRVRISIANHGIFIFMIPGVFKCLKGSWADLESLKVKALISRALKLIDIFQMKSQNTNLSTITAPRHSW